MTERTIPEGVGDERSLLDGWLDYYRATLLAKCDGLTGPQLITRSCEPSPMSLIGLVRHMTESTGRPANKAAADTAWPGPLRGQVSTALMARRPGQVVRAGAPAGPSEG